MKTHFNALHKRLVQGLSVAQKKEMWKLKKSEYLLKVHRKKNDILETASCRVAYQIARKSKPFVDGEFVKACAIDMLNALNLPDAAMQIGKVPLSQATISRRIDQIATLITESLKTKIRHVHFFHWPLMRAQM